MEPKRIFKKIFPAVLLSIPVVAALSVAPTLDFVVGAFSQPAEIEPSSDAEVEIAFTDEELAQLLNGETTLQELENGVGMNESSLSENVDSSEEESASSEESVTQESTSGASSASSTKAASSTSMVNSTSQSTASPSSKSNTGSTASSTETVPAYEAEVKALLQELYTLRARAMSDLDACIASAKAEYKALPEEQQTQTRKVTIAFSKAGQLASLQSYYDKEVNRVVSEMRRVLSENGQSTELADQAMASYKNQKNEKYAELMNKLYE